MREGTTNTWSIGNDIIKIKTMEEHRPVDLNMLIVSIENFYFMFIANYAYIYKYEVVWIWLDY